MSTEVQTPDEPQGPCRTNVSGLPIGQPCPECGHSGLVHPHAGNQVDHCLLCDLVQVIELARTKLT